MLRFCNKILLRFALFGLFIYSPLSSAENCSWLSWHPDFAGKISRKLCEKYRPTYWSLYSNERAWYGGSVEQFVYSCLNSEKKKEAFRLKFMSQDEAGAETLVGLYSDSFIRAIESSDPEKAEEYKEKKKKATEGFIVDAIDRAYSRICVYEMFLVNELCRKSGQEPIECQACLELTTSRAMKTLEQEKERLAKGLAPSRITRRFCSQHKKDREFGAGIFSPKDFSHGSSRRDIPSLELNPEAEAWRMVEKPNSTASLSHSMASDLRVFVGDEDESYENLLLRVKKTQTDYGYAFFDYLISNPSNDYDTILQRRELIKRLVEDDELYEKTKAALAKLASSQRQVTSFLFDRHDFFTDKHLWLYPEGMVPLKIFEKLGDVGVKPFKRAIEAINRNPFLIRIGGPLRPLGDVWAVAAPLFFVLAGKRGLARYLKAGYTGNLKKSDLLVFEKNQDLYSYKDKGGFWGIKDGLAHYCKGKGEDIADQYKFFVGDKDYRRGSKRDWRVEVPKLFLWMITGIQGLFLTHRLARNYLLGPADSVESLICAGSSAKSIYKSGVKQTPETYKTAKKIAFGLADFSSACRGLSELMTENPVGQGALTLLEDLHEFVSGSNEKVAPVLRQLEACKKSVEGSAFQDPKLFPSFFNPEIFSSLRQAYPVRWFFSKPLEAVGQIDAFVSMATVIREHKKKGGNGYCFADFRKTDKPGFRIKDFWNPYIDSQEAVPNSLSLGWDETEKHMLLCGPNGGGKSTLLRAVSTCVLMGQTFGVAPAKSCSFSIYDKFDSCMATKDKPAEKRSLFMVQSDEVNKMRHVISSAEKAGKLAFVVIDEIYGGTGEESAVPLSLTFGKEVSESPSSTLLLSSHFWNVGTLESMTNGVFKNFRVVKEKNPDGSGRIKLTYKLTEGRPDKFEDAVGIQVAHNCGTDDKFIAQANELKQKLYGVKGVKS